MPRDGRVISDTASGSVSSLRQTEIVSPGDGGAQAESTSPPVDVAITMPQDTASSSVFDYDLLEAGQEQQQPIEMGSSGDGGAQTESTSLLVDPSQPQQQPPAIPRVRGLLRRASCDLFMPQTVVIGPYHVREGSYFLSREVKDKAVEHIVETRGVSREELEAVLSNLVNEVRPWYTHLPEDSMNFDEFSSMLLLDGCYLLCRFINFQVPAETGDGGAGSSGHISADPMILDEDNTTVRDILYLLDNQIPLCVLEAILNCISGTENVHYAPEYIYEGVQYVLHKQHYISQQRQPVPSTPTPTATPTPSDLLHLVYSYFRLVPGYVAPGSAGARDATGTGRWRRATDYYKYADMQFRPRKFQEGQQWTILDLDIQGGTLYIPQLQVDTNTMTMLRNLMALEEHEKEKERPVTAYCLFMSQVAGTAEDVQLLQRAGILQHFMASDEEAANDFANLCAGLAMDINSLERNYLKCVWHDLDKRSRNQVHNCKGFFREKYWSTPFYRLVFVVAILTFVSTATQAICSVIGLLPSKKQTHN